MHLEHDYYALFVLTTLSIEIHILIPKSYEVETKMLFS